MDLMVVVIISLRLLVPLIMLRWPLFGVLASVAVDGYDYSTLYNSVLGGDNYQLTDKLLDTYFLAIALYASRRWTDKIAQKAMLWLFGYRVVGVLILLITGQEYLLFFFPNLVLDFFIFYLLYTLISSDNKMVSGWRDLTATLTVILIPKMINEYYLHVYRVTDTPLTPYLSEFYALPSSIRMLAYFALPGAYLAWKIYRSRSLAAA